MLAQKNIYTTTWERNVLLKLTAPPDTKSSVNYRMVIFKIAEIATHTIITIHIIYNDILGYRIVKPRNLSLNPLNKFLFDVTLKLGKKLGI